MMFLIYEKVKNKKGKMEYVIKGGHFTCRDSLLSYMMIAEKRSGKRNTFVGVFMNPGQLDINTKRMEVTKRSCERRITEALRVINLIEEEMGWKKTIRQKFKLVAGDLKESGSGWSSNVQQDPMNAVARKCSLYILKPSPEWMFSTHSASLFCLLLRVAGRYVFETCKGYKSIETELKLIADGRVIKDHRFMREHELMISYLRNIRKLYKVSSRGLTKSNNAYSGFKAFTSKLRAHVSNLKRGGLVLKPEYAPRPYVEKYTRPSLNTYRLEKDTSLNVQAKEALLKMSRIITKKVPEQPTKMKNTQKSTKMRG